jgi:hypothetical protein
MMARPRTTNDDLGRTLRRILLELDPQRFGPADLGLSLWDASRHVERLADKGLAEQVHVRCGEWHYRLTDLARCMKLAGLAGLGGEAPRKACRPEGVPNKVVGRPGLARKRGRK